MKSVKTIDSLWKEISQCNFKNVLCEIEKRKQETFWSFEDDIRLASNCLISINKKCHEAVNGNINIKDSSEELFSLTHLCCQKVSTSWDLVSIDIPTVLFYICKHLLQLKEILKGITICEFAFQYLDAKPIMSHLSDKTDVPAALLLLFLREVEKLEINHNNFFLIDRIWSLILAPVGMKTKCSNIEIIMKFFTNFILKCCNCNIKEFLQRCSELIRDLMERISEFNEYKTYVNELKVYQNVFLISAGNTELSSFTKIVGEISHHLKSFISAASANLNRIVFCTATMLFQLRNLSLNECIFNRNHIPKLFEMFLILAEQMSKRKKNEKWKSEITIVVWLSSFVLELGRSTANLDLNSPEIYVWIKKAFDVGSWCFAHCRHLDQKKKISSYYSIGVAIANMCQSYTNAKLPEKSAELCLIGCEAFLHFSIDDMSDSTLQLCVQRLIKYLCNYYSDKGAYLKCMQTAVVWSIIFPNCAKTFMNLYGFLKHKLWSSDIELQLVQMTCWHVFNTRMKNEWQHENLKNVHAAFLLLLELEQCKINNITSVVLMRSILKIIEKENVNSNEKIQIYIRVGEILTNSNDKHCLEYAKKLMDQIDSCISRINKKLNSCYENQNMDEYLLGDLHYIKFRVRLLSLRSESEAEVKVLNSIKHVSISERGMEQELKDKANDIPTNYTYASAQLELIRLLDITVKHWCIAVQNEFWNVELSRFKDVAMIYRLYCNITKEICVWELLYKTAKAQNSAEMIVYAYANLLLTPWNINQEWKKYVENEALQLVSQGKKLLYQLNHFNRCLVDGFTEEDAQKLREISVPEIKKWNLWSNYCYLISRCELKKIILLSRSPSVSSYLAYCDLMHQIKRSKWSNLGECCELQCFLFDLVLFIVAREADAYRISLARQYLIEPVNLIQKLSLPLRSCQFLSASARLDTMTCNLEDCFMKLSNAFNILSSKEYIDPFVTRILKPESSTSVFPVFASDVRSTYDGHSLDVQTSPIFAPRQEFRIPDYMNHEINCLCSLCSNVFYSYLLCEIVSLFAEYYRLTENLKDAKDYFNSAYSMQKVIENRMQSQNIRILFFWELKPFINFFYANYLAMKGEWKEVEKLARESLQYCSSKNLYVNPACWQLLWFASTQNYFKSSQTEAPCLIRKVFTKSTQISSLQFKTPLVRKSVLLKTEGEKNLPLMDVTPVPRRSRRALFHNFATLNDPTSKQHTGKKNKQCNTPPDIVMQTPSVIEKRQKKHKCKESEKVPAVNNSTQANCSLYIKGSFDKMIEKENEIKETVKEFSSSLFRSRRKCETVSKSSKIGPNSSNLSLKRLVDEKNGKK